ncbi:MAG TPA: hypothetical protein PLI09_06555 [Candidatus Hydrogenedentes bacterium]|nr:hypothetical protein [Candidatus Hydrogenedentota bacterium]
MIYEKSVALSSNVNKALELGKTVFAQNSFRISRSDRSGFDVENPFLWQKNRNPLVGINKASITLEGSNVTIHADIGKSVIPMMLIICLTTLASLGIIVAILMDPHSTSRDVIMGIPIPIVVLFAVSIGFYVWNRNIKRAIDVLLENMAIASRET